VNPLTAPAIRVRAALLKTSDFGLIREVSGVRIREGDRNYPLITFHPPYNPTRIVKANNFSGMTLI